MRRAKASLGLVVTAGVVLATPAAAVAAHPTRMGNPAIAAVQVALRARHLYSGTVDGIAGNSTRRGVRAVQRRHGLAMDGVAGPRTLGALGRRGRPRLGGRPLRHGLTGFDVAELQFLLAWHGFPSGPIDGGFGSRTTRALRRFQAWFGGHPDGVAGSRTVAALFARPRRSPLRLALPVRAGMTDRFGPRGNGFHPGVDFPARTGTPVFAARSGTVVFAGWDTGGYGYLVAIAHGAGVRTMYAHLSHISVRRGQRVSTGTPVGRVGSTGRASGPHLHFELRLRGAAIDPLSGL
jgi:peptidoglycan hydrolase-like protein with peptidoglycan-binding domain